MPRHDTSTSLRQMRDFAREAVALAAGRSRPDLDADRMLELSLTHLLEIIGEAASRVPENERDTYPRIPWRRLVGLRNRLIHGYDQINLDIVWRIVSDDLPALINELGSIVSGDV